jgi:hypothetical protein
LAKLRLNKDLEISILWDGRRKIFFRGGSARQNKTDRREIVTYAHTLGELLINCGKAGNNGRISDCEMPFKTTITIINNNNNHPVQIPALS